MRDNKCGQPRGHIAFKLRKSEVVLSLEHPWRNILTWIVATWWRFVFWYKHRAGFLDLGRDAVVRGTIVKIDSQTSPDGDFCFSIEPDPGYRWAVTAFGGRLTTEDERFPGTLHCEVSPWTRHLVDNVLPKLALGTRVEVAGRWGYDGVHTHAPLWLDILRAIPGHAPDMAGGWCEIHPVTVIHVLAQS